MAVDQNCHDSHQKMRSSIKACEVSRKKYSRNYTLNLWLRAGGGVQVEALSFNTEFSS